MANALGFKKLVKFVNGFGYRQAGVGIKGLKERRINDREVL